MASRRTGDKWLPERMKTQFTDTTLSLSLSLSIYIYIYIYITPQNIFEFDSHFGCYLLYEKLHISFTKLFL